MKKVIRLNENDVEKLVKKIIREQDNNSNEQLGMDARWDLDGDDQAGYNIGHNTAEELMILLNNSEGDKDESIVWAFVDGFMENVDPSVADLVIDSLTDYQRIAMEEVKTFKSHIV